MSWTNICIEGFCFVDGDYPCGNDCTSHLCIKNGHCPHFAYSETTERNVATFPPFILILKDRLSMWAESIKDRLVGVFWHSLWFNRRKVDEFFKNMKSVSSDDCPELKEFENEKAEAENKFNKWFKEVNNGKLDLHTKS